MHKLTRDFYNRNTETVARSLLGKLLIHCVDGIERIGKITEVEAYLGPTDLAAHSSKGNTPRTRVMFGPPGYAYVYLIYGMHHCLNVVTDTIGSGTGVLLRALKPIANLDGVNTRGPGRLCKAMGIDRSMYGHDLCSDDFYIAAADAPEDITIAASPRIGVDYAGAWATKPLRFYIYGSHYVSRLPARKQHAVPDH
ncbi:DNA-3-methyladenine glycosylase [Alcaligenaceae bacterium]|nr:DNA-3-methyladenine glycosylase [Alcaligenaceae bacterium]